MPPQAATDGGKQTSTDHHADIHQAADIGKHGMGQRTLWPGPLPEGKIADRHTKTSRNLGAPQGKAKGNSPRVAGNDEDKPAQHRDDNTADQHLSRRCLATPPPQRVERRANGRDQSHIDHKARAITGVASNGHLAKRAPAKRRRQQKRAKKRAENEKRKRHKHPAGTAPEAEQHARPAPVRQLHANAEYEGADDQRNRHRGH